MVNLGVREGGGEGGVSLAYVKLWHMLAIILADIRCVCVGVCARVCLLALAVHA